MESPIVVRKNQSGVYLTCKKREISTAFYGRNIESKAWSIRRISAVSNSTKLN